MEAQFNFQLKNRNDKREWENIEVYYQTHCDRITARRYARKLSKIFNSEIRMQKGTNHLKDRGIYFDENEDLLKVKV